MVIIPFPIFAIIFVSRREGFWISSGWFKLVVLGSPLLVLAAAMQGSQWDEFSDWLAIPRYLLSSDFLPSAENTYASANAIAYPFGWQDQEGSMYTPQDRTYWIQKFYQ